MFENDHPTISELQQYHRELDAAKGFDPDIFYNALLLLEEVGELAAVLGQAWRVERRRGLGRQAALARKRDELAEELADCLAYLVKLANYAGVDLEAAYVGKMRRNAEREWNFDERGKAR